MEPAEDTFNFSVKCFKLKTEVSNFVAVESW